MFYSHEVLTSRKYGVATVWLVATLGSKSALRKVNRKAITKVNVAKACDTIKEPTAPMALRLQSSLLYGVVQVYSQQCQYFLLDAQNAYNSIQQFSKGSRSADIDATTLKARPEQLELADDPAFMPGLPLLPLDLDLMDLDMGFGLRAQSLSLMSPDPSAGGPAGPGQSLANLFFPECSSELGGAGFHVQGDDGASARFHDPSSIGRRETMAGLDTDADFGFDADGNVIDIQSAMPSTPTPGSRRNSGADKLPGVPARQVLSDAGQLQDLLSSENLPLNDDMALPDAEPFPFNGDQNSHGQSSETFMLNQESSSAASAPLRKSRARKPIAADSEVEIRKTELSRWNQEYNDIMILATNARLPHKASAQAKKNAEWLVLGRGIGNVGYGVGTHMVKSPFDMYCGDSLWEMVTGQKRKEDKPRKRSRDSENFDSEGDAFSDGRRVRARDEDGELGRGLEEQLEDENGLPPLGDDTIELPRDEMGALDDHHMSSAMPWNITASIRGSSVARGRDVGNPASAGPSAVGLPRSLSRQRMVSASPLQGRGSGLLGPLSQYIEDLGDDGDYAMPFTSEPYDVEPKGDERQAPVTESQQLRDALDLEGQNFLAFIEQGIVEKAARNADEGMVVENTEDEIIFGDLLPANENTRIVAAQAFLHVLSLATKNLVYLRQDEAYGEIGLRLVEPFL